VFCLHFVAFYAFSGTNLLTRCHSASSCFLLFLCFRKVTQEIFSELDETIAKVPIYLTQRRSPEERRRSARRQPHHRVARATPWPRHQVVWAPGPPSDIALLPINSLRRENPMAQTLFHETYCKPPPLPTRDREGPEAFPGTLREREIITGGLMSTHVSVLVDNVGPLSAEVCRIAASFP
jgi:hypothetical protein